MVETFNTRNTYEAYIGWAYFSLYFIAVICKNVRLASTN